jgi:hypothetical protein
MSNLQILKKNGTASMIKKAEWQKGKKMIELASINEQIREIKNPFSLDDIVIYIQRKFWHYIRKKKVLSTNHPEQVITSQKIRWKIRRGISIWVHRNEELKKIRINAWLMIRMIKIYEKIVEKYTSIPEIWDDPKKKVEITTLLRKELDSWEKESNGIIDQFSLSHTRRLRDQIIAELLSKK